MNLNKGRLMGLFINQDNKRTDLQNKLAAELQDKARQRTKLADLPDGVESSQYIKGTKQTTKFVWLWILIIVLFLFIIVGIIANGVIR